MTKLGWSLNALQNPPALHMACTMLTTNAVERVPAGTFRHVVETFDTDPLNPQKVERKFWAPGVGAVHVVRIGSFHQEEIKLTSYSRP